MNHSLSLEKINKRTILNLGLAFLIVLLLFDIFIFKNLVAIVVIEGFIGSEEASQIIDTLNSLEKNPLVRAIVLKINSPGGSAEAIHAIYFELLKIKNVKPIVSSIDQSAASGAYYLASQSDYIFAKQSSEVGGIGTIVELPKAVEKERIEASGPFKIEIDKESAYRSLEYLKKDFLEAVKRGRGERLKIEPSELTSAKLYIGYDAKYLGLIDEIGGIGDAIEKARQIANLPIYRTAYFYPYKKTPFALYISSSDITSNTTSVPVYYFVYVKVK
jgi:protease-4